jgi:integrase
VFARSSDGRAAISPDGVSHRFQELAAQLGVRARLHDLHHFMVTQLVAGGVDWRTVSGRAGHADGHMTLATSAHFQQAQDRQAAGFQRDVFCHFLTSDSGSLRVVCGGADPCLVR